MPKSKYFLIPLFLAALLPWIIVPATGRAADEYARIDRINNHTRSEHNEGTKQTAQYSYARFGGSLCHVFSSHPFFMTLTPFSWCMPERPEPEPEPMPEPEPLPSLDHLIISEVYYDVDATHGTEASNEWIEIYNGTGAAKDVTDWTIEDATSSDTLPEGTILPNDSFGIITRNETTEPFWAWPSDAIVIFVDSPLGNGLGNTGDVIYLKNSEGTIIDSVSWGTNTDAFDPSVPDITIVGSSIARDDVQVDTDTAADWVEQETPDPGE